MVCLKQSVLSRSPFEAMKKSMSVVKGLFSLVAYTRMPSKLLSRLSMCQNVLQGSLDEKMRPEANYLEANGPSISYPWLRKGWISNAYLCEVDQNQLLESQTLLDNIHLRKVHFSPKATRLIEPSQTCNHKAVILESHPLRKTLLR